MMENGKKENPLSKNTYMKSDKSYHVTVPELDINTMHINLSGPKNNRIVIKF